MARRALLMVCASWLLAACAGMDRAMEMPAAPVGQVVVREYTDPQKRDGVETYFRIRYYWDYDRKIAVMERASLEGKVLESKDMPGLTLNLTPAELEYAIALVKNDRKLRHLFDRSDLHFHGGFSVREPGFADCNEGSRCARIFVSTGPRDEVAIARTIVDLATRRVVDRGER